MPGEHKDMYVSTTLSIVIFTTVVCGGLTAPMMNKMGMRGSNSSGSTINSNNSSPVTTTKISYYEVTLAFHASTTYAHIQSVTHLFFSNLKHCRKLNLTLTINLLKILRDLKIRKIVKVVVPTKTKSHNNVHSCTNLNKIT